MRKLLFEKRAEQFRKQTTERLSMLVDIYRDVNLGGVEIAPGYPAGYDYQPHLTDEPAYVWNLLYLLQGEFVFPEREYAQGQLRAIMSYGLDIKERDEIRNIRINGDVLWPGPLNIFLVVPHSGFTLLVLRGAH